jgi:hypothetical protein
MGGLGQPIGSRRAGLRAERGASRPLWERRP